MLKDHVRHIPISEFKANCLEIVRAVEQRKLPRVVVTRRGKPVAELLPPAAEVPSLWGAMEDSISIPQGVDLTEPFFEETWEPYLGEPEGTKTKR